MSPDKKPSKVAGWLETRRTSAAAGGLVALGAAVLLWSWARPSNRRRWVRGQHRLATGEFAGNEITVRNVRCFSWSKTDEAEENYEDRTYDADKITSLDFIVSRFGLRGLAAHTMLSFGFSDGQRLTLSVEIRRREGQHFSILQGLFRSFELQYIFGDERDLVHLRTNIREENVYLFPVKAPPAMIRALWFSTLRRANTLAAHPEFYHSVANACTTNLIKHFNEAGLTRARERGPRAVVSGLSDALLHDLGLIGNGGKLRELRREHRINSKALAAGRSSDFSARIRA
jgi:hypothetical protein